MHRSIQRFVLSFLVVTSTLSLLLVAPVLASARTTAHRGDLDLTARVRARARNQYNVVPLVSDGFFSAPHLDAALVNPWGLARGPAGPWWVADNGTEMATLYSGDGVANPLVVSLPRGASPTGLVFNGGESFVVSDGTSSGPALFLFAGEDGRLFGWNPVVPPPPPSSDAFPVHDASASGAIYKGLAIANTDAGDRLYLTDFHNQRIDVLDGSFHPVALPEGAFVDVRVPDDFSPFGIQNIMGRIFVTYAKQDADREDDVAGQGLGFVDVFDVQGLLLGRIATRGLLNSPWGLALAPQGFGRFGGDLLVGNFGDGRIVAYELSDDLRRAVFDGLLSGTNGRPVSIEGLWALGFGNNLGAGSSDTLFFTSGPGDEQHGLFGKIEAR
ncbi:MAG TPA: TIGR03118 family protein [Candidatus Polarisedimenticolia bacterium]|nr:TIGR03118 family protein [Candidatus Polarisedimenticolia bacterium]